MYFIDISILGTRAKPCSTPEECRTEKIVNMALIIVFLVVPSIICCICCCSICYKSSKKNAGIPKQYNTVFVHQNSLPNLKNDIDPFETGTWSLLYQQYGRWHGPYQLSLSFKHSSGKVTGHGSDDVGDFTIDGIFSSKNLRLGLTQKYKAGTGNPSENLGHISIIQLQWNSSKNEFDGKWYVKTYKYSGNGHFKLRLEESSTSLLDVGLAC